MKTALNFSIFLYSFFVFSQKYYEEFPVIFPDFSVYRIDLDKDIAYYKNGGDVKGNYKAIQFTYNDEKEAIRSLIEENKILKKFKKTYKVLDSIGLKNIYKHIGITDDRDYLSIDDEGYYLAYKVYYNAKNQIKACAYFGEFQEKETCEYEYNEKGQLKKYITNYYVIIEESDGTSWVSLSPDYSITNEAKYLGEKLIWHQRTSKHFFEGDFKSTRKMRYTKDGLLSELEYKYEKYTTASDKIANKKHDVIKYVYKDKLLQKTEQVFLGKQDTLLIRNNYTYNKKKEVIGVQNLSLHKDKLEKGNVYETEKINITRNKKGNITDMIVTSRNGKSKQIISVEYFE